MKGLSLLTGNLRALLPFLTGSGKHECAWVPEDPRWSGTGRRQDDARGIRQGEGLSRRNEDEQGGGC